MKHVPLKKRFPFFAKLPAATMKEIKRRSKKTTPAQPEWQVIAEAFGRKKAQRVVTKITWKKNSTKKSRSTK